MALKQSTKTQFFTAAMSWLRDVIVGLGALMSTRQASSVMLYPLMPQMIQQCGADQPTEELIH